MKTPLVSVVLPVYNAQDTIVESMNSILNQTFTDIELIVINDGSKDLSEQKIMSIKDERIRYFINDSNRGLIYTLNRGLKLAVGKYIARMDADDISVLYRIEKQVALMESNSEIVVCGSDIQLFGSACGKKGHSFLLFASSSVLKDVLVKVPCFAHPTVMIRKSVLDKNGIFYDEDFLYAEDYKLWIDLVPYGDFCNINEKLLYYRISDSQITQPTNIVQINNAKKCRREYLKRCMDPQFMEELENKGVTLRLIRLARKYSHNRYLLEILYLSLKKYTLDAIFYYFFSFDCVRLGKKTFFQFMKRVILSPNPYL